MAATKLKAMHQNKGRSVMRCLKDRTDYAMNGEKTDEGKYISSYQCNPELVDLEFAQAKKEYLHKTWRQPKGDVIAYQIRQSFKPGEITPEEANEVGYGTGMRFTKGKHAFIVATHVNRVHIHNHIIFNSTNLECDRKFRDFWFSGIALQRLSDIICLEHGFSVIPKVKPSERQRRTKYPERVSMRDVIREDILKCLDQKPSDFEELLKLLQAEEYETKRGKHIFLKLPDGKIPKVKDLNEEFAKLLSEKKGSLQRIQENKKRDAELSDSEAKCGILLRCSAELGHRGRHEKETESGEISMRAIIKNINWRLPSFFIFRQSRNVSALTK